MTDDYENEVPEENNDEDGIDESELSYDNMKTEEPERPVTIQDYKPSVKTESEEEEESSHLTDIQSILRQLRPKFPNKRLHNLVRPAMDSRIPADNLTDKHFLLVASLMEEQMNDKDFDPIMIVSHTQDALLIGFEGRGIADLLELAGVSHEAELDKLSKELGMAG